MNAKYALAILFIVSTAIPVQGRTDQTWGSYGYGYGMMGPGMMMGGGGIGYGGMGQMMGGNGMMGMGSMMGGYGMMGMGGMMSGYAMLDLSSKQWDQLNDLQIKLQKQHWQLMGKMIDQQDDVRKAWNAAKPDPKKVGAAYAKLFELQRQAIEERVAIMNKMYDQLTDKQREQLKSGPRGMWRQGGGGPMGGGGHMMMQ